jgi:hypothetical protein
MTTKIKRCDDGCGEYSRGFTARARWTDGRVYEASFCSPLCRESWLAEMDLETGRSHRL